MKNIKHIIFDCDGVIVDSEILASKIAVEMLQPSGYKLSVAEHTRNFSGLKEHEILSQIEKNHGVSIPEDFMKNFVVAMRKAFVEELQAIDGMVNLIRGLDLPKSVVSNSLKEDVVRNTTKVGVLEEFEGRIFAADMVEHPKPAPDLYLFALEKNGLNKDEAIVIEDSVPGVTAARAAGLYTIGFLGASHIFEGHKEKLLAAGAKDIAKNAIDLQEKLSSLTQA
ncbi:MAG: HAD-IA family hydrolase [Bacteroidia bacterium]|nr:HAD-IA family hydrolase [Bacteroidia bacterium]